MERQKPFFQVSSWKEYRENDPDRFASRRMDKPAPILIDNAEEWEAEGILDYRLQTNLHEFLVHWKGYEWADDSWEPIKNLEHSLELIQEYWNGNHPTELTPKITSHYVKAVREPMEVPRIPCEASAAPDDFWEPYQDDDKEYDCSSSEVDYFPIYNDDLLWHQEDGEESDENWERIWYLKMRECNMDRGSGSCIQRGAMDFICLRYDYFVFLDLISYPELFSDSGSSYYV